MKKILTILVMLFFVNSGYSQEYHSLPDTNAVWNFKTAGSQYAQGHVGTVTLGNKITIGEHEYREVGRGGIRQNIEEKKVYYHNGEQEILLYDFSLEQGDSIYYPNLDYYKVVEFVSTINIDGQERKQWYFYHTESFGYYEDIWIEGIGSIMADGLLFPYNCQKPLNGTETYFGCFTDGEIVYINGNACGNGCPCDNWLVDTEDLDTENKISILPNPAKDAINIELNDLGFKKYKLEILSSNGKILRTEDELTTNLVKLNVSSLSTGFYFIRIVSEKGTVIKKFVKQ